VTLRSLSTALLVPPLSLVYLAAAGLLLQHVRPRLGRIVAWASLLGLIALAVPAVGFTLMALLERGLPLTPPPDDPPQAIVILSGDISRTGRNPPEVVVGNLTLERERTGAMLARRTRLPVLVTGGVLQENTPPIAALMADSMWDDFQVPVRWTETRSEDTWENARFSAAILRAAGIRSIYLVTNAWHMRRALLAFAPTGLVVTAAPTDLGRLPTYDGGMFIPRVSIWQVSYYALHEWIGLAYYATLR
jgi:uncharacterized SAM-binding protein YcdF (DUF218 family)